MKNFGTFQIGQTGIAILLLSCSVKAEDMVTRWNNVFQTTVRADSTRPGPTWASRNEAIMNLAVYEAVNSIQKRYQPFYRWVEVTRPASSEAAAAQAAAGALKALYPSQSVMIDINLEASLRNIPAASRDAGVAVGRRAAELVLSERANDGSETVVPYVVSNEPGNWRPDPLNPDQQVLGANWGGVKPFTLASGSMFRCPQPPALNSVQYTESLNEVRNLGAYQSPNRSAEQLEIGMFWGYDRGGLGPPPLLYSQITETIGNLLRFDLVDNARLFAMTSVAMADAGIAAWESKFHYNYWRPVTGIREAATDTNPQTEGDPTWVPMGAPGGSKGNFTPPFPAYPSGHATFGAAVFRMLELLSGTDRVQFFSDSEEVPAARRFYNRFSQAAAENARSRIYLGIHWNFDDTEGRILGRKVADRVFTTKFAPILRTSRKFDRLEMYWPALVRNFAIEQNPGLGALGWSRMPGQPTVASEEQMMAAPLTDFGFYRLIQVVPQFVDNDESTP